MLILTHEVPEGADSRVGLKASDKRRRGFDFASCGLEKETMSTWTITDLVVTKRTMLIVRFRIVRLAGLYATRAPKAATAAAIPTDTTPTCVCG